jgi:hypothetical protein
VTPAQAAAELLTVNEDLRSAIDAVPLVAATYDRKRARTFTDLTTSGESVTASREWATVNCVEEAFDLARAKAKVESLRERQAILVFLLEHDLLP